MSTNSVDLQQLLLQLGIAGAILLVFYLVAMKFIDAWTKSEAKRTEVLEAGLGKIADRVADAHNDVVALKSAVETVLDLTPVRGVRQLSLDPKGSKG